MTGRDIVKRSLRLLGVIAPGETPPHEEVNDAFTALNAMLSSWGANGLMVFAKTYENFALTASTGSYTIGSGGDFDTARPLEINHAFVRDTNGQDYTLDIKEQEVYNSVLDKDIEGRPEILFYDPQYSLGIIYLYYVPDTSYTLYLTSTKHLSRLSSVDSEFSFPPEYEEAVVYSLAVRLAPEYGVAVPTEVVAIATESTRTIRHNNAPRPILNVGIPDGNTYRSGYNIYTDEF